MKIETLKYIEAHLTEWVVTAVERLPESNVYTTSSETYQDMLQASQALKDVRYAIKRAENRAARKAKAEKA